MTSRLDGADARMAEGFRKTLPAMMLLALIANALASHKDTNYDIYFMMAEARAFLNGAGFFTTDPLTMHEGLHATFEKWLSSLIFYGAYRLGGWTGICMVESAVGAVTMMSLLKLCRAEGLSRGKSYAISYMALALLLTNKLARPQIFTYMLLVMELYVLETSIRDRRRLLWLVPIAAAEINLHSTQYPIVLVFIIPYLIDIGRGRYPHKKELLAAAALMIPSMLINPYGISSLTYIIKSYNPGTALLYHTIIGECRSVTPSEFPVRFIYTLAVVVAASVLWAKGKTPFRACLLTLGTAMMTFDALRNMPYMDIAFSFMLIFPFRDFKVPWDAFRKSYARVSVSLLVALLAIFPYFYLDRCYTTSLNDAGKLSSTYLDGEKAVDWIAGEDPGATVYCGEDMGSYAEYAGLRPYFDSRFEIYMKEVNGSHDYLKDDEGLKYCFGDTGSFLERYGFDYIVATPYPMEPVSAMEDGDYGYRLVRTIGTMRIFKKEE